MPQEITQDDFFSGVSAPRNKELMRVFKDVDLVEQLGSGMERIMSVYDKSIFEFLPNENARKWCSNFFGNAIFFSYFWGFY